jgi:hypothetical protein
MPCQRPSFLLQQLHMNTRSIYRHAQISSIVRQKRNLTISQLDSGRDSKETFHMSKETYSV